MEYNPLLLENQLCFPLYACAREIVKKYKPYLDRIGLTYTQYITMMVLWEKQTINVKSLGEALFLDSGTLTPLLKKMEGSGLLTRKRSLDDERNLVISLTKKGQDLRQSALDIPYQVGSCLKMDHEHISILRQTLNEILNNL